MAKNRSDQALVEHLMVLRAQVGDRDAYRGLFGLYNRRLLYYLRRRLPGAVDAEDVLQDVWLTVVKKVATLEQPEAFKAWIYRIAHNLAVSRLRQERPSVPLDELPEELEVDPAFSEEDDEGAFAAYDAAAIHAGLERLSPAHREALTLRFIDQLSYEEIAQVVGRSLGTVRSRIHYARKSLHEHLVPIRGDRLEG